MDEAAIVATLCEQIAIPSVGGTEGEIVIQQHLAGRLGGSRAHRRPVADRPFRGTRTAGLSG